MPLATKYALTESARACDSAWLSANLPPALSGWSSVWPWISSLRSPNSWSTATALSSVDDDVFCSAASPVLKLMPWITPVNCLSFCGISSGQPSSSWYPFLVSGSVGHLSLASSTPSPSLSGSGQPSSSWKPSLSSGSFGHLSAASGMPSPSLSGSGQPSSSWKPSLSSASFGHLSAVSGMPSPSLSGSGQPSSSWKPSLSSGSFGHLSASPTMPSLSGSLSILASTLATFGRPHSL